MDKSLLVDIKKWIIDEFNSKEVIHSKNSNVYSFEFNEFQVDFILTEPENWNTSKIYFSYNDLHNLIGKIAHKFGLKWGHTGLSYVYRIDGKLLGKINVSKDYEKSLEFLGFDVAKYNKGFDTLNEIFDFITCSKYFNPWIYDLENLNATNRLRDKKRKTYAAFVQHVIPLKEKGIDSYHYFYTNKNAYLGLIDYMFPGFLKQYKILEIKEERLRKISSIYNGNIIMEYFNISGIELGKTMAKFELEIGSKRHLEDLILETNDTKLIMDLFGDYNNLKFK